MENSITDLFEDSQNIAPGTKEKSTNEKDEFSYQKDKFAALKSSFMMEAMGLMSKPKKLKGIATVLVLLLLIGVFSTIYFFIIYPICIICAIGVYVVIAIGNKIIKSIKEQCYR